jgi:uncharacterized membrane protein
MSSIQKQIDVQVPVRTAYNQWTQFEEFPEFMENVERVTQLDDKRLHWCANVGGKPVEWDAVITEQIPDKRIAWRSTSGAKNAGVVTFHRLSDETSRVALQLDYDPEGMAENLADWLGVMNRRTEADLERFKQFIEARGAESGAYRGTIPSRDERGDRS